VEMKLLLSLLGAFAVTSVVQASSNEELQRKAKLGQDVVNASSFLDKFLDNNQNISEEDINRFAKVADSLRQQLDKLNDNIPLPAAFDTLIHVTKFTLTQFKTDQNLDKFKDLDNQQMMVELTKIFQAGNPGLKKIVSPLRKLALAILRKVTDSATSDAINVFVKVLAKLDDTSVVQAVNVTAFTQTLDHMDVRDSEKSLRVIADAESLTEEVNNLKKKSLVTAAHTNLVRVIEKKIVDIETTVDKMETIFKAQEKKDEVKKISKENVPLLKKVVSAVQKLAQAINKKLRKADSDKIKNAMNIVKKLEKLAVTSGVQASSIDEFNRVLLGVASFQPVDLTPEKVDAAVKGLDTFRGVVDQNDKVFAAGIESFVTLIEKIFDLAEKEADSTVKKFEAADKKEKDEMKKLLKVYVPLSKKVLSALQKVAQAINKKLGKPDSDKIKNVMNSIKKLEKLYSSNMVWIIVAVVVAVLVGAGVFFWFRWRK